MIKLDQVLDDYCRENQISGMLRVTKKDQIIYKRNFGYAIEHSKTEFTDDSMFTFYSMSKPLCAIGLLRLKDLGLINIDVHPKKYLKEASCFDDRLTIRHLLHHVSGIPDPEQTQEFKEKYIGEANYSTIRKHVELISKYPSYFAPNTSARYTNINFMIPALIIENVTGQNYFDYMKENVFLPLGMKTAIIDDADLYIENRVQGYELIDGKRTPVERSKVWLLGAGDVVGTVDDAYCLNKAYKNKILLKQSTWEEIVTPSPINSMGLGNTVFTWHGKKRINHNGGHYGFRTMHVQLPEDDFDIILLSNSGYGNARDDIAEIIYQTFYGTIDDTGEKIDMDKGYI